jgi:hypothetical protein
MKKLLTLLIVLAIIVIGAWKFGFFSKKDDKPAFPKDQPISVSKNSESFNQSMMKAMDNYYQLTESFVNWDTAKINSGISAFKSSVDSIQVKEMEKDSAIYPTVQTFWEGIKAEITGMQADTSLYAKRESLNSLSQQLFDLLRTVKYDAAKVYYQECPMALNNYESSAFWLSTEGEMKKRRNPYLGLYDPKYGRAMLTCGSTRDSISFVSTTGK